MSSWRDRAKHDSWKSRAEPVDAATQAAYESAATGGGSPDGAERPRAADPAPTPIDPREIQIREEEAEHEKQSLANAISGGQYLHDLGKRDPKAAQRFSDRQGVGAAAEMLSLARGATGPIGAHLDEIAGAVKSGHLSGPEYEREKGLAHQTMTAATRHAPVGPVIGAMLLPQPASALGRVGLNATVGASDSLGEARKFDGATTDAMKKAAVAAVLSALTEGAAKAAKGSGNFMSRAAEEQALKAAGLRGGITNQAKAMGLADMDEARALGRRMLDEDLIPFGGSKDAVLKRADALKGQAGSSIGAELAGADISGVPFDYDEMANAALEPFNNADMVMRRTGGKSLDLAEDLMGQGKLTPGQFSGANRAKSSAWDSATFAEDAPNAARLYRQTTGAAAGNIADQLRRAVGDEGADAFKAANEKFGVGADTATLAAEAARREGANNSLGMTELLTGIAGATMGSASGRPVLGGAGGITAAFLANLAKKRGNAAAAVALDKMSALGPSLDVAGDVAQRAGAAAPVEMSREGGLLQPYLDLIAEDENP